MFDINKDGKISYEELYSQFCKVAQMIVIRDKNMMDSFRKMVMTKNKKSTDKMTNTCKWFLSFISLLKVNSKKRFIHIKLFAL